MNTPQSSQKKNAEARGRAVQAWGGQWVSMGEMQREEGAQEV